jgi:hypothetical protein
MIARACLVLENRNLRFYDMPLLVIFHIGVFSSITVAFLGDALPVPVRRAKTFLLALVLGTMTSGLFAVVFNSKVMRPRSRIFTLLDVITVDSNQVAVACATNMFVFCAKNVVFFFLFPNRASTLTVPCVYEQLPAIRQDEFDELYTADSDDDDHDGPAGDVTVVSTLNSAARIPDTASARSAPAPSIAISPEGTVLPDGWKGVKRVSLANSTHTYTHRHTHRRTHTDSHMHTHAHTCTCIHAHRHTQTRTDAHRRTQTHTDTHRHVCT